MSTKTKNIDYREKDSITLSPLQLKEFLKRAADYGRSADMWTQFGLGLAFLFFALENSFNDFGPIPASGLRGFTFAFVLIFFLRFLKLARYKYRDTNAPNDILNEIANKKTKRQNNLKNNSDTLSGGMRAIVSAVSSWLM